MTDFKLADTKLESSVAYLPKLEKNLSKGFEIIDIFFVKMRFQTHADISNVFIAELRPRSAPAERHE